MLRFLFILLISVLATTSIAAFAEDPVVSQEKAKLSGIDAAEAEFNENAENESDYIFGAFLLGYVVIFIIIAGTAFCWQMQQRETLRKAREDLANNPPA